MICFYILSGIYSDILSGILSRIYFDIPFGLLSGIRAQACSTAFGAGVLHSIWSWRYGVRVQACPSASGAGDMVFGSRRALQHPELATWLGKTRLTSGGAGVGARGRGQDEGGEEGGRKEGWKEEEEDEESR